MFIVDFIKAVSCVLIFLHHCNTILPGEWKFLTLFGQDLGNNLFFMVSGFSLYPSIKSTSLNKAPIWYLKRLSKIMPFIIVSYILSYCTGFYSLNNPMQIFAVFIFPTLYWFISAILIFYIILFILGKILPNGLMPFISILLLLMSQLRMSHIESFYFLGLSAMILGFFTRSLSKTQTTKPFSPTSSPLTLALLLTSTLIYLLTKFNAGLFRDSINHFLNSISVLSMGSSILYIGAIHDELFSKLINEKARRIFRWLGQMALPVYIVQCFNSGAIGFKIGESVPFPLSFLINLFCVWGPAALLHLAINFLNRHHFFMKFRP
ncbi:MAG: acyltransferase family protein [Lachnospiraceae bacterium]|nr:acyltransferase family protein [Lachnospiraceae bacterium]